MIDKRAFYNDLVDGLLMSTKPNQQPRIYRRIYELHRIYDPITRGHLSSNNGSARREVGAGS